MSAAEAIKAQTYSTPADAAATGAGTTTEAPSAAATSDQTGPSLQPLDLAAAAELIATQHAHINRELNWADSFTAFTWGIAWLLGYGWMWWGPRTAIGAHSGVVFIPFGVLLGAAIVATAWAYARSNQGLRGPSERTGKRLFATFTLVFLLMGVYLGAVTSYGISLEIRDLLASTLPPLLVGAIYMTHGAHDRGNTMFLCGAAIYVTTCIAVCVGIAYTNLVMSLAGGGCLLLLGAVETVRLRRAQRL